MADGVNIDGLKQLYRTSAIARAFLDRAAQRERERSETTVERTQATLRDGGTEASRGEVVSLFQEFERLGCGKFVVGRWNKQSRMSWSVSIISVGKAAAGEQQVVAAIPETMPDDIAETTILEHRYFLRPEMQITLALPLDLTEQEAERLSAFIKTLPMNGDDAG